MSSVPRTVIASANDEHEQRRERRNLAGESDPERARESPLEREHNAIEIRVGEYHDAESDDGEQRKPTDDELRGLPRTPRRMWRKQRRSPDCERPLLSFDDSALDHHAATGCPRVAHDTSAFVDANVAVEGYDVAFDGTVDVEIASRDRDGSFNHRLRGDCAVAKREVLGVRQPFVAGVAPFLDFFCDLTSAGGRSLRRFGGINGPGLRRCPETPERQCGECEQRAHCYARRRLEAAARARSPAMEPPAAATRPSNAAAMPKVPVR